MITPILEHDIDGKRLRYFTSPEFQNFRKADMPWHSADDLSIVLGLPQEASEMLKRKLREDWNRDVKTVATPEGITTIAPHFMAQGLIASLERELGEERASRILSGYTAGGLKAMRAMTAHLSPSMRLSFMMAARSE